MIRAIGYVLVALALAWSRAPAQELTLQKDCETGFRELMRMAQHGALGADVRNANVRVDGPRIDLELVRADAASTFFRLGPKASDQAWSRYFDISLGPGAALADAERVGRALNVAFTTDPFVLVVMEGGRGDATIPGVVAAWRYGGWYGVARVLERRMIALVSVRYTVIVILALAAALGASVMVLALSLSPPRRA